MSLEVVQVQQSALPTGAATEATLGSLLSQLASVLAALSSIDAGTAAALGQAAMASSVPVAIASNQSAVPVSGSVAISGSVGVTGPLTDTQLRASAVPVSVAGTVLTSIDAGIPAGLGQTTMAGSMPVVIASDQPAVPVSGPLTDTQLRASAVPVSGPLTDTQLRASAVPVSGPLTDIQLRASAVPVSGPQTDAQLRQYAATNWATATAAVNTVVTCTLPAPGAGLFHYITSIRVTKLYAIVGVASAAGVVVTSTNLPGSPAWTTEQVAAPLGTASKVIDEVCGLPIKSSAANLATTIVCPAQAQTIWRVNVTYYTGP